jgi:hypothetical protein
VALKTVRHKPFHAAGALLIAGSAWYGWHWYQHRPRPVEPNLATFKVVAPEVSSYVDSDGRPKISPHPLELRFSRSVAALERVGKPVTGGITMSPSLEGDWTWPDDHTLRFTPANDWPVGAHIKAGFDGKELFAPQITLKDDNFEFDVKKFTARVGPAELSQNALSPASRQALIQVRFNYPVDPVGFEKRIALALLGRDDKPVKILRYSVIYDEAKLNAWVRSEPLDIPRDALTARLNVDSGLKSSHGGNQTTDALQASVNVPGLYSLAIAKISPTLVDNDRFEPEQVLVVETSDAVRAEELASRTKAWVLPKRKPAVDQSSDGPPYEWQTEEVSEALIKQAQPLTLESVPTDEEYASTQSFKFRADPGARIYVRVDSGLKSSGGYLLGASMKTTLTVPAYPKLLRFMANGSLLSMSGSKRISIVSHNLPGMKLEIGRVVPEQIQNL